MPKISWKPGTMLYPLPAVMVSCGANEQEFNILTVSWTGTICTDPPMCYISVRPQRHSYEIIKRTGEFVINLTNSDLVRAADWCGVKSGKDFNKFAEMKLTPDKAQKIGAPLIAEAPVNLECVVKQIVPLGTHDMFIAEVVAVNVDDQYLDPQTGAFDMGKAKLICYAHGLYYRLGDVVGKFGFSVQKKKIRLRNQ